MSLTDTQMQILFEQWAPAYDEIVALRAEVEAMRAKCEAIAREEFERTRLPCCLVALRISKDIAALKSKPPSDD